MVDFDEGSDVFQVIKAFKKKRTKLKAKGG